VIFLFGRGVGSGSVERKGTLVQGLKKGFQESPYLPPTGGALEIKGETE
jgi:hypothetical protein